MKRNYITLCASVLSLFSCVSQQSQDLHSLRLELWSEPVSLDPTLVEDGMGLKVVESIFDGLVGYDGSGILQKRLAQSIVVSPDQKRFVFELRKNAQWSDGREVKNADFIYAFQRAMGPKSVSKLSIIFSTIHHAKEFHEGTVGAKDFGVFEKDGKLVFELDRPTPYFLDALTLPSALPLREDVVNANQGKWPSNGPTTGPYVVESYELGKQISLKVSPLYWGKKPTIPSVLFFIVNDPSTALNLFQSGKLDLLSRPPSSEMKRLRLKDSGLLHVFPFAATYYVAFNVEKAPFSNRDYRRAVAGVIHKNEIAAVLETGEPPARSWIPPGFEGFLPYENERPLFNDSIQKVKKAKPIVDPISASFDSSERNSHVMEKIQADVQAELPIKFSLINQDWKSYVKGLQTDSAPFFRFAWLAPFQDVIPHLQVFVSDSPNNYTHWSSKTYDDLVQKISTLKASSDRTKLILKAQKILIEDEAVVIPIFHYVQNFLVSKSVSGFRVNDFGIIRFEELSLTR